MDQEVIRVMLSDVLPGLLQKYILHDTVPIVVGGVPLNKCANDDGSLINDIDIKFVCSDISKDASYNKVHKHRMAFVKEVIQKYNILSKLKNLPLVKASKLRKQYAWRVEIGYMVSGKLRTIIDTGIIMSSNTEKPFNKYLSVGEKYKKLALKTSDFVVPYDIVNDIPYASCKWMYIDTVRVLYDSLDNYNQNSKSDFWKLKVLKYIQKYISIAKDPKLKSLDSKIRPLLNKESTVNNINIGKFIKAMSDKNHMSDINSILRSTDLLWEDFNKAHQIIGKLSKLYPNISLSHNGSKLHGDSKETKAFLRVVQANLTSNLDTKNVKVKGNKLFIENLLVLE